MFAASLNPHGSPYYWAFVGAITLAFAVVDLEALRAHRISRFHGFSVAVYVTVFVIVVGVSWRVGPGATGWWVFPAAVRVAVWAVFIGGQLLAGALRGEQRIVHGKKRRRSD
jgi:hypothetical protein